MTALSFAASLDILLRRVKAQRIEPEPLAPVAYDDPQRNPNYCWTHNAIYPACANMH
ncbi:hypothetical protein ABZY09_30435 [Streptomyces sp. NPDC002928]|uniref:hypothetical protein n=1 Tax=Streptomyces sp. NPDC002928 TaxID=3154440 RepID=UPI0033ABF1F8